MQRDGCAGGGCLETIEEIIHASAAGMLREGQVWDGRRLPVGRGAGRPATDVEELFLVRYVAILEVVDAEFETGRIAKIRGHPAARAEGGEFQALFRVIVASLH